ncbi:hypothetical protein EYW49_12720 [Siculibacillus lacustris]|uniref:Peptidoglycan binding-like domain-containing protein n=1 Tax=Siculibacillus lacustris TaxID=1549641 RepID=A0A4V2KTF6_9HYPH|nr:hypothetical protein [Siculibacillus lacustris]TBW37008.1 hypothetical protein EYW49_12720 [Siculibacillus lacustris]
MARVTNMPKDIGHPPVWIWDVSEAVGPGRPNRRPDVGLVQVALNQMIRPKNLRDTRLPFNAAPDDPLNARHHGFPLLDFLEVDGWFGKDTAYAIGAYQAATNYCVNDGVVSPVFPMLAREGTPGWIADLTRRTMYQLNYEILQNYKVMLRENLFPPFLRDATRTM